MPTPTKGPRLGGGPAHERLLLANLATQLFEHGRITTTEAKARRLRPFAERLVTKAKRGDLHARRQVLRVIRDKGIAHVLFEEIGPRFANRPGGYTRITKIGPRKGDNAPMAVIELVEALTVAQQAVGEAEAATRRSGRDAAPATTAAVATPATGDAAANDDEAGTPGVTSRENDVDEQIGASSDPQVPGEADQPLAGQGDQPLAGQGDQPLAGEGVIAAEEANAAAEGGAGPDQQVPAEDPAEGSTSPQTQAADRTSQAEGEPTEGEPGSGEQSPS